MILALSRRARIACAARRPFACLLAEPALEVDCAMADAYDGDDRRDVAYDSNMDVACAACAYGFRSNVARE